MARRSFTCFHMVGMVASLTVLGGFRSLSVSSIVSTMRLVISVTFMVPSILVWGVAIVWAIVLMEPLIRPMTISVSVLAVPSVSVPVLVTVADAFGCGLFLGLLFAAHVQWMPEGDRGQLLWMVRGTSCLEI